MPTKKTHKAGTDVKAKRKALKRSTSILPGSVVTAIQKVLAGGEPMPIPIVQYDGERRSGEELTELIFHYLSEVHYWAAFLDRPLFQKNLKLIADMLEEEAQAWSFTEDEQKRWKATISAALGETSKLALAEHWQAIYGFWWDYHRRLIG